MNGMFHNGNLLQWSDSSRAPSLAQEFPIRQQFLLVQFRPSLHQPPLSLRDRPGKQLDGPDRKDRRMLLIVGMKVGDMVPL